MSWVNDLASVLGIPSGAATLAVAMYSACSAAEKAARPEALKDIGRILKDPSWSGSARPSAVIERVFAWTFGERHLSWRRIAGSMIATLFFSTLLEVIFYIRLDKNPFFFLNISADFSSIIMLIIVFLFMAWLPDYFALAKTGLLLKCLSRVGSTTYVVAVVPLDILLSFAISMGFYTAVLMCISYIDHDGVPLSILIDMRMNSIKVAVGAILIGNEIEDYTRFHFTSASALYGLFFISTMLTSVWTVIALVSTSCMKLLAFLQYSGTWFFDVCKHPVKAIGIVSGALVMLGALIWAVLRMVV